MNNHTRESITVKSYFPLILVFAGILIATVIKQAIGGVSVAGAMADFMGFFFIIFGLLKTLDLRGFVDTYRSYDLIARKSLIYAYCYPFIELALGIAFLTRFAPTVTSAITVILMAINSLGVLRALRDKQRIVCACLGTFLHVPLTHISLVEDLLMLIMGLVMLFLS